jgi:hypothetical protein
MTDAPSSLQLALLSAAILGFRHGFDYDHIAAITDITSVQTNRWQGMRLGLLYALGHAAMVAVLGSAVIVFQLSLPHGIDRIAERLVGLTLLVLGVYVLGPLENAQLLARSRCTKASRQNVELHLEIRTHDRRCPRPRRGDAESTDDLFVSCQSWWDREGLHRSCHVYRRTAGHEHRDDRLRRRTFRI